MMIALFAMISFVTGLANPMGVIVKNQFGATNFMSQLGTLANFIAYAFMGVPAGLMLQKIGYKKTALAAVAIGFIGVGIQYLSGVAESFYVYLLGAFVAGFSMCMLNTVVNPMLNTLGGGGKKGNQLIQIGGTFNSLMATIVPVLVGYLMGDVAQATIKDANPAMFIAMGIFALVFIVLMFVNIPEPDAATEGEKAVLPHAVQVPPLRAGHHRHLHLRGRGSGHPQHHEPVPDAPGRGHGSRRGGCHRGHVLVPHACRPLRGRCHRRQGIEQDDARRDLAVRAGIRGRCHLRLPPTTVNMPVFKSDISFGLTEAPINVLFLVLCGLCTSVMWGSIFNLAVEGIGKYVTLGSGFFMVMVCGGGILPTIQGAIADASTYMTSYWIIFAGLAYLLYYAAIGCKNVNKDIKVD